MCTLHGSRLTGNTQTRSRIRVENSCKGCSDLRSPTGGKSSCINRGLCACVVIARSRTSKQFRNVIASGAMAGNSTSLARLPNMATCLNSGLGHTKNSPCACDSIGHARKQLLQDNKLRCVHLVISHRGDPYLYGVRFRGECGRRRCSCRCLGGGGSFRLRGSGGGFCLRGRLA